MSDIYKGVFFTLRKYKTQVQSTFDILFYVIKLVYCRNKYVDSTFQTIYVFVQNRLVSEIKPNKALILGEDRHIKLPDLD